MSLFKVTGWKREDGQAERKPMWPQLINAESNLAARRAYADRFAIRGRDWWPTDGSEPRVEIRVEVRL